MKQEEKDLLLKDLCSRLPYGVKCCVNNKNELSGYLERIMGKRIHLFSSGHASFNIDGIKPYLYPLSSMTEEQKKELHNIQGVLTVDFEFEEYKMVHLFQSQNVIDWLNKNHFDYRGLIEKGLAIDCTNLNIY